ncbi:MAG: hypothetical protein EBT85_08340 [Synechococcaceae bacterium WB5_2B_268]|nr:hypothetical protein [Synechococcaceae bacterium WB5_2B_268]
MLDLIKDTANPLLAYIKDDPVRPDIPVDFRVSDNRFVGALVEEQLRAMICVSLHDFVPKTVDDLSKNTEQLTTAIFYTIWSYSPGAATQLLFETVDAIKQLYPTVHRFVTLSPKTAMARRFHLKNGASVYRENTDTINYEYII